MAIQLVMPKLGLTMTEGLLTRWLVENGQEIKKGQPIFEIETDKLLTEAEAETDGIVRVLVPEGSSVEVLGLVGYILAPGEDLPEAPRPAAPPERAGPTPLEVAMPAAKAVPSERKLISPAARRRARELGLDIEQVKPLATDGRISVADVEAFAAARARPPVQEPVEEKEQPRIPIRGVRQLIAERMRTSRQQTAPVTLTTEVDATELIRMRKKLNDDFEKRLGLHISYNDILVKIAARCLEEFPYINAREQDDAIYLLPNIAVGVAVDTRRGLLVPVVRDAHRKPITDVARELREKSERAIAGKSLSEDLTQGTFTITNLGALGVDAFTPIINYPEIAILGIGRIQQKPAEWQGRLELRYRVVLSFTFDHRLVDGAPAARFLKRLSELIEKPSLLAAEATGWAST